MKLKLIITSLISASLLVGCGMTPQKQTVVIPVPFDEEQAKYIKEQGTASISGQAFLRQNGGGVVTCAGSDVRLIPVTDYAEKRMLVLYGAFNDSSTKMYLPSARYVAFPPDYDSVSYVEYTRKSVCDASGNFTFTNIAKGSYFLTTSVTWNVMNKVQGGPMAQLVHVEDKENKKIIMN